VIGLVADDLTGACDSAAPFLVHGAVVVTIWPRLPGSGACQAISTESRNDEPEVARERSRRAVAHLLRLRPRLLYRKVDSRLRGNLRADLEGALEAGFERCLLAPALPAEGRITRHAVQLVGEETIPLAPLLPAGVEVRDAETDADLDSIAREALLDSKLLVAGTAGLAAALSRALGPPAQHPPGWSPVRRPLALVGSRTEVSAEQVERARAAGWDVHPRAKGDPIPIEGHDALFLSGGATAAGVITALGGYGLELLGEALPRLPVGRLLGGPHAGLTVCLKAGGFGRADAITEALRRLTEGG
jgi:uncharacterized protein YgbK (DUF1537 family)